MYGDSKDPVLGGFNLGGVHLADLFRMEHKCSQMRGTIIDDVVSDTSFSSAHLPFSPVLVHRYLTFLLMKILGLTENEEREPEAQVNSHKFRPSVEPGILNIFLKMLRWLAL